MIDTIIDIVTPIVSIGGSYLISKIISQKAFMLQQADCRPDLYQAYIRTDDYDKLLHELKDCKKIYRLEMTVSKKEIIHETLTKGANTYDDEITWADFIKIDDIKKFSTAKPIQVYRLKNVGKRGFSISHFINSDHKAIEFKFTQDFDIPEGDEIAFIMTLADRPLLLKIRFDNKTMIYNLRSKSTYLYPKIQMDTMEKI